MCCWALSKQCSILEQTAQSHPCPGDAWLMLGEDPARSLWPPAHLIIIFNKQPTSTKCTCQKVRQWLGRSHDSGPHSILTVASSVGLPFSACHAHANQNPKWKHCVFDCNISVISHCLLLLKVFLLQTQSTPLAGVSAQLPEAVPGRRTSRNSTRLSYTGVSGEAETTHGSSALGFQSTLFFIFNKNVSERK